MEIRLAEPADLPSLVALGVQYYQEAGSDVLPVDIERATAWVERVIAQSLAVVVEEDGVIRGGLLLDDMSPWWTSARALFETGFYVDSKYRKGTRAAAALLDAGKAIATDMGLPFFVTPITEADTAKKERFFAMQGFKRIGGYYRWENQK